MKVLIIEDENPAAEKLQQLLQRYDPTIEVLAILYSVSGSKLWFDSAEEQPDLIFMDIKLTDGLSFELFNYHDIKVPIIFITAFNEYAIQAFQVNSIDYLLKPLQYSDLAKSMEKMNSMKEGFQQGERNRSFSELNKVLEQMNKSYKTRFMIKVGDHIRSIKTDDIALFYAEGRTVHLFTTEGRTYIIDFTLETLDSSLDPAIFFRTNRSFIVNINAIADVIVYSNSRLKVLLHQKFEKEIIVSRDKVGLMKTWLEGA